MLLTACGLATEDPPAHILPSLDKLTPPRGSAFREVCTPAESLPGTTLNAGFSSLRNDVPAVSHLDDTVTQFVT